MDALRYKPLAFFKMDDSAPYQDYSGYNVVGSDVGTTVSKGISLAADTTYSTVFGSAQSMSFLVDGAYAQGKESQAFSLSAIIYLPLPSKIQIVSKNNTYDGIWVDNGTINFGTTYSTTGTAVATYTPVRNEKFNIVGVHTQTKNSLYVNSELVAEVDITPEQQADTYADNSSKFTSGVGNDNVLINNIAVFPVALRAEEIRDMYDADSRRPEGDAAKMFGGEVITLGPNTRGPYLDTGWYSDADWETGQMFDVEAEDGVLYASVENDLTLAGTWLSSVSVFKGSVAVPINSINLWWLGQNVTVEVSVDSITWTVVTKGVKITSYGLNQTPTNDSLFVRVTFTAGVDEAWIEGLRVHGYTGTTAIASSDRVITYPDASVLFTDDPDAMDFQDDWGVNLRGGTLTIGNTDSADYPKTIEVWWMRSGAVTTSSNISVADTVYTNGIVTADRANEWVVKHYVRASGFDSNLTFSGNVVIGQIALYPTALSASDIAAVVQNYTGTRKVVATSGTDGTIALAESPTAWLAYSHDWEILSA